jgi:hypothetical protein
MTWTINVEEFISQPGVQAALNAIRAETEHPGFVYCVFGMFFMVIVVLAYYASIISPLSAPYDHSFRSAYRYRNVNLIDAVLCGISAAIGLLTVTTIFTYCAGIFGGTWFGIWGVVLRIAVSIALGYACTYKYYKCGERFVEEADRTA